MFMTISANKKIEEFKMTFVASCKLHENLNFIVMKYICIFFSRDVFAKSRSNKTCNQAIFFEDIDSRHKGMG